MNHRASETGTLLNKNARYLKRGVLLLALILGCWGISWRLPNARRIAQVLPPEADTPAFRQALRDSWHEMYRKFGEDLLLHPESFTYGFDKTAVVNPGWSVPPAQLMNSARSFHLRSGHEDESDILVALSRLRPHRLELNPHIYFYGGTYMYSLGAWIAAISLITPATLKPDIGYYLEHPDQIGWIYLLGRLFSVAIFVCLTWFIYLTGRRFFTPQAGLLAAAWFAVSPGIVIQAHYMKPHLLGALCVLAAFYCCAKILEENHNDRIRGPDKMWVLAGALVGLAAGSVFYLWNSGILLLLTLGLRLRADRKNRPVEIRRFSAAVAVCVLVFFLTNPYLIYDFHTSWAAVRRVAAFSARRPEYLWIFPLIGFPKAVTLPIALLVLWGLMAWRNTRTPVRLLAWLTFISYAANTWIFQSAHMIDSIRQFPVASLGFLLAATRLLETHETRKEKWKPLTSKIIATTSIAYGCLVSGILDYNFYLDASGRSTRETAGVWIEANIPSGSELGFLRLPQPSNAPYLQWSRYRLKFIQPDQWSAQKPKDIPQYLILTLPAYDDRPKLKDVLTPYYQKEKDFPPFSWMGIMPPAGESHANPLIEIYKKR